jgi:Flp pilus assembly protein TadB
MKIFWMTIAGVAIAIAAVLILRGNFNAAFVVAAIGLIAWFLNYRVQMKEKVAMADLDREKESEDLHEEE